MSPLNIQNTVDEYHSYSSTVLFTWNAPEDNSHVDYYQYTYQWDDGSVGANTSNTSNTSVAISGVPYNKNITFSVLAGNCIGESATVVETVNIGNLQWNPSKVDTIGTKNFVHCSEVSCHMILILDP